MDTNQNLKDKRIAVLLNSGFSEDQLDLIEGIVKNSGGKIEVVSADNKEVRPFAKTNANRSTEVDVDAGFSQDRTYDGVIIPDGVLDQTELTEDNSMKHFIEREFEAHTPIVAIGSTAKALEDTQVFSAIKRPEAGNSESKVIRAQDVMYVKEIKDDKAFSNQLLDFLNRG